MPLPTKIRDLYTERLGEVRNMIVTDVQLQNNEDLSLKQDKLKQETDNLKQESKVEQIDSLRPETPEQNSLAKLLIPEGV